MVPTMTWQRPAQCFTVSSTRRRRSSSVTVRNSPVVPRMITPGTPEAICQSRKRFIAASSIADPSAVKGVTTTL